MKRRIDLPFQVLAVAIVALMEFSQPEKSLLQLVFGPFSLEFP